ncbi:hypothetical protein P167DRAFT_553156 [Morchella conica CCBAS932]|uniref:ApbA-domain-containing protein n=1 Tax=Morchella conica CCBAS932 TaxID=1392247 RepID=A0A3N4KRC4_9PEZI|nr:hypothetical protein P167DRAFT_553156 [Morchella conica CCBAS932]
MAPASPRLRILSVGGNSVSAFLSWRLQATNACDVTLVWKSGHDTVSQYGISFKSGKFGNERFKPHSVVRSPEEAAAIPGGFDYVLLCVKALPDLYDVAAIIDSVVTPQHTCIVVNTTYSLGIESYLESRFPTNIVLSLVNGANIIQSGPSEFEHAGASEVWVGSTNQNPSIPMTLQLDMAEALALTLASGNVECHVSANIRQQQWEKMIGPIAFQPLSVLLETPVHSVLIEKAGAKKLIPDLIDELIDIAKAQSCSFPEDFKQKTIDEQLQAPQSMMYQDFVARRPLEIENYLGSPIKFAQAAGVKASHCQALYTVLHHVNTANQTRPPTSPAASINGPGPRPMQNGPQQPRPQQNGINGMNSQRRPPPPSMGGPPMGARRGPPPHQPYGPNPNGLHPNGYPRRPQNGSNSPQPPSRTVSRRNSFDNDLEEFGHLALYDELADSEELPHQQDGGEHIQPGRSRAPSAGEMALREREFQLRQRELALREQEISMRQNGHSIKQSRRKSRARSVYDDDDDEDDGYVDAPPPMPPIDPDNFDMMSLTSRRTRRLPSAGNLRGSEVDAAAMPPNRTRHSMAPSRPGPRSRVSARLMSDVPGLHDSPLDGGLMGYSSNRYGSVDRKMLSDSSRANSLTARGLDEITGMSVRGGGGAYPPHPGQMPPPPNRRTSMSPGDVRPNGPGPRPGYPADQRNFRHASNTHPPNGHFPNGHPPPNGPLRQPSPRFPEGQVLPQQAGQIPDGVSQTNLLKGSTSNRDRSTTGSASASADSGASGQTSAASSSSSLERRMVTAVR